jgi:hypothetical protein
MPPFENDHHGLASAVASAQVALWPLRAPDVVDADDLDQLRALSLPPPPGADTWGRKLQRQLDERRRRFFWREQAFHDQEVRLFQRLLRCDTRPPANRPPLLFLLPYDITAGRTGGAVRFRGLARGLASEFDVRVISLVGAWREPAVQDLGDGIRLYAVPYTRDYEAAVAAQQARFGAAARLLAMASAWEQMPLLAYWTELLGRDAAAVVVDGPALLPLVRAAVPGRPLVYEAQNVYRVFAGTLGRDAADGGAAAAAEAAGWESEFLRAAGASVCVSAEDLALLAAAAPKVVARLCRVPNGVDSARCLCLGPADTARLQRHVGWTRPLALFVGASYGPNLDGAAFLVREVAPRLPAATFALVGLTREAVAVAAPGGLPGNVVCTGSVEEGVKETLFALADCALCPVEMGSGSSLKVPDYAAHGKCIVTTPFGLRGFEALADAVEVVERPAFADRVASALAGRAGAANARRADEARALVARHYDWSVLWPGYAAAIRKAMARGTGV